MKKDILTVFGCSSSLAFTLFAGSPVNAESAGLAVREYVFTAPVAETIEPSVEDCGCSIDNNVEAEFTDEDGDRAIERFGCDCAGCRYIVREEMKLDQSATSRR